MENTYLSGFGNHFSTEARAGALPLDQNSPQVAPLGLYAEQLSGSAFTAPRHSNLASWLYRIRPSVMHKSFTPLKTQTDKSFPKEFKFTPNQLRWSPAPLVNGHFLDGLRSLCTTGPAQEQRGLQVLLYSFNKNMGKQYFMNADGEMLIVLQSGKIQVKTEFGIILAEPGEIVIIPKGIKIQVNPLEANTTCAGYIAENFGHPLRLPDLGPIGANGLAHRRHFLTPAAAFEDLEGSFELVGKFHGELWGTELGHSPLDVVAWHGNYAPYKYDLRKFNTVNTVSFDHPDPSIFTVLTSPSDTAGTANFDFAIFPPRWMVAENTFRPPYFHRNCMSEYMGLIYGEYDAKTAGGFVPGGGSLHNIYSAHGPDADAFSKASAVDLKPHKIENSLAFMFESRTPYLVSDFAMSGDFLQKDYQNCWQDFKKNFKNERG